MENNISCHKYSRPLIKYLDPLSATAVRQLLNSSLPFIPPLSVFRSNNLLHSPPLLSLSFTLTFSLIAFSSEIFVYSDPFPALHSPPLLIQLSRISTYSTRYFIKRHFILYHYANSKIVLLGS